MTRLLRLLTMRRAITEPRLADLEARTGVRADVAAEALLGSRPLLGLSERERAEWRAALTGAR